MAKIRKIKVLLIDDDEDDYILTKNVFREIRNTDDYELSWVDTFEKGINAALKQQHDIYLVDYRLGKYTGIDLLKEAILSGVKEPIIMLTGKGDYKTDEVAMNLGAADYLLKEHLNSDNLERAMRYAIKQGEVIKSLKLSEYKYKSIFEKAKDPILISDYTGKIHNINNSGLQFFGYNAIDILQISDRSLFYNQEERDNFIATLERNGAIADYECQMVSSAGQVYYCSLSSFLQIDTVQMVEVYHTIIHDLTSRKDREDQNINKNKSQFSSNIANGFAEEIRNPLSTINLVLHELGNDESLLTNEFAQKSIEIVKSNLDAINDLTKNFIRSTEVTPIVAKTVDITEVIDRALLEIDDMISGYRITLEVNLLPGPFLLHIDEEKVKTAILNILQNAIEAMEEYPKKINISSINDSGFYTLLIEDNGPGIDEQHNDDIFNSFFSTKKNTEGLGLTIAKKYIMAHGGNLIYKPITKGSLFILQLPISWCNINFGVKK